MSERTTSVLPARISYADAKRLASDGDVKERRALAARGDVRPEILYFLAEDPVAEVRREIAVNDGAPRHADLVLARDADAAVREELAAKIARLTPELMPHIRGNLYKLTVQALEVLARDQVVRVRQLVAEALQDQANAPAGVISILARDDELAVCGPVLRYSPVLTDADLLAIIRSTTVQGALRAISHRDAVSGDVADAIAAAGDVAAVADLLGNDSAQVREETLDRIIEGAVDVPPWHAPLVRRPRLPVGAAIRLARFVAHPLLHELQNRADLDAQMVKAVAEIGDRRLTTESSEDDVGEDDVGEADGPAGAALGDGKFDPDWAKCERTSAGERVQALLAAGKLDEAAVADALRAGERPLVIAAIAALAKVPATVVSRVIGMHDAKSMLALAWQAGLSIGLATRLQQQLAGVAPAAVIGAGASRYPLAADELEWQLEFITEMA